MPRLARIVVPDFPHHVTQRGNRRQQTFFSDADFRLYLSLISTYCAENGVKIWAYCLMPNHVHLILKPRKAKSLAAALSDAHRCYSRAINFRQGWRGYLWQGRFASFPMDGGHVLAAAQYVELNPVRARLVKTPQDWPWSSARAHLTGQPDGVVDPRPLLDMFPQWDEVLEAGLERAAEEAIERSTRTGRPLGSDAFMKEIERISGRPVCPKKPGRKPQKLGVGK